MSDFSLQQNKIKEKKEKDKTRREKLAGYFFDLSKLVFAALVLGGITPLFSDISMRVNWLTVLLGIATTYVFASFANRILK